MLHSSPASLTITRPRKVRHLREAARPSAPVRDSRLQGGRSVFTLGQVEGSSAHQPLAAQEIVMSQPSEQPRPADSPPTPDATAYQQLEARLRAAERSK